MITSIRRIKHNCSECNEIADFKVIRTIDELSGIYAQYGSTAIYYCTRHMPEDCKQFWNAEISDSPEQQIKQSSHPCDSDDLPF